MITAIKDHFHLAGRIAYISVHEVKAGHIKQIECQKIQCLTRIVLHLERVAFRSAVKSSYFFVYSFFESEKLVFTAHGVHSWGLTNGSLCQVIITRKDLALSTKTNQRPSSKSVLMEVRLVHAATRGFFFPLVTPRSRLRRSIFTANTRKKNPLASRVVNKMAIKQMKKGFPK